MQLTDVRSKYLPVYLSLSLGTLGCEASAGFRPNNEAVVQQVVINEMRVLGQFLTTAQMEEGRYLGSTMSSTTPAVVTGILCPLPAGFADGNGNGIPDDLTIVFTAANCPNGSVSVRGEVRIQDIGGPWGVRVTYNDLQGIRTLGPLSLENAVSGVLEMRQTSDTTLAVRNTTTVTERTVSSAGTTVRSHINDLTSVQTGLITRDATRFTQPLPRSVRISGTIAAVGAFGSPTDTLRMAISTTTPLSQTQLFCLGYYTSGELAINVTGVHTTTLGIRFSC